MDNPAGEVASNTATVTVQTTSGVAAITLASRATSGAMATNRSWLPSLSANGNLVAFISDGTNLVPGVTTGGHAYLHNLATGVTTLINQTPGGEQSSSGVIGLKLAAGGRYAIFTSLAGDLVAGDDNGSQDVFVRDLETSTTKRVSLHADGTQITNAGNGQADMYVDISADGAFISFMSIHDLLGNEPSGTDSLYFRSIQSGFLVRVASTDDAGTVAYPALSANGEHLVYLYNTFTPGASRNTIVQYDTEASAYHEMFSVDSTDSASFMTEGISVSGDGRYITFPLRSPSMFNGSVFSQVLAIDRQNPDPHHHCEWKLQWLRQWQQLLATGVGRRTRALHDQCRQSHGRLRKRDSSCARRTRSARFGITRGLAPL